jgi:hypothetical protein
MMSIYPNRSISETVATEVTLDEIGAVVCVVGSFAPKFRLLATLASLEPNSVRVRVSWPVLRNRSGLSVYAQAGGRPLPLSGGFTRHHHQAVPPATTTLAVGFLSFGNYLSIRFRPEFRLAFSMRLRSSSFLPLLASHTLPVL